MRILIVSDAWEPQINGVVRTYQFLLPELAAMGHSLRVVGPQDFATTMPLPFYPEIRLAVRPFRRLSRIIEASRPDLIHIGTEGPLGWAARRWCLKNAIPFTSAYHTQFGAYLRGRVSPRIPALGTGIERWVDTRLARFHNAADVVLIATPSLEDDLRGKGFVRPFRRMTRGVDTTLFSPEGERTDFGLPRPLALSVGRVSTEKNLEAFLTMPWAGGKVVVGDGPRRAEFSARYPGVRFTGKLVGPALAAAYRGADVFVFPSRTDTFGMVLVEAMACGLPIAAYPVTGPRDIVTHDPLGVLHDDLETAANRALTLTGGAGARAAHARETYSWGLAARQFIG